MNRFAKMLASVVFIVVVLNLGVVHKNILPNVTYAHSHFYSQKIYYNDSEGHYRLCQDADKAGCTEPHLLVYGKQHEANDDGKDLYDLSNIIYDKCKWCGARFNERIGAYVSHEDHKSDDLWSKWERASHEYHYRKCNYPGCGVKQEVEHDITYIATGSMEYHDIYCDTCKNYLGSAIHSFHNGSCTKCGKTQGVSNQNPTTTILPSGPSSRPPTLPNNTTSDLITIRNCDHEKVIVFEREPTCVKFGFGKYVCHKCGSQWFDLNKTKFYADHRVKNGRCEVCNKRITCTEEKLMNNHIITTEYVIIEGTNNSPSYHLFLEKCIECNVTKETKVLHTYNNGKCVHCNYVACTMENRKPGHSPEESQIQSKESQYIIEKYLSCKKCGIDIAKKELVGRNFVSFNPDGTIDGDIASIDDSTVITIFSSGIARLDDLAQVKNKSFEIRLVEVDFGEEKMGGNNASYEQCLIKLKNIYKNNPDLKVTIIIGDTGEINRAEVTPKTSISLFQAMRQEKLNVEFVAFEAEDDNVNGLPEDLDSSLYTVIRYKSRHILGDGYHNKVGNLVNDSEMLAELELTGK